MWHDFLYSFWIFAPAGMANVTPILVSKVPGLKQWNTPIDFGRTYKKKQIFGSNKTWRGLVCGVCGAELVYLLQKHLTSGLGSFTTFLYTMHYLQLSMFLGILLGLGVIVGDALESFLKRQHNIKPGSSWYPFDQLDYVIGACLFAAPVVIFPIAIYIGIFIIWFLMSLLFSYIGFLLGFKTAPI